MTQSRPIEGGGFSGAGVSDGEHRPRHPDIACAGGRLFVAWLEDRPGGDRVLINDSLRASPTFGVPIDLGAATASSGAAPVVAGVNRMGYVAWREGNDIRLKRFRVGFGPGFALTPLADTVVGPGNAARPASGPVIAADGRRVVVAWERCGDTFARVSDDRGATFGPVRLLRDGPLAPRPAHPRPGSG